jgi:hypothetical protein
LPFNEQGRAHFERFQLTAAYIAAHPKLREVVEELEESKEAFDDAQGDPRKYLEIKGLELPDGWTVKVSHDSPLTLTVCVNSWCLSYTFASLEVTHR